MGIRGKNYPGGEIRAAFSLRRHLGQGGGGGEDGGTYKHARQESREYALLQVRIDRNTRTAAGEKITFQIQISNLLSVARAHGNIPPQFGFMNRKDV